MVQFRVIFLRNQNKPVNVLLMYFRIVARHIRIARHIVYVYYLHKHGAALVLGAALYPGRHPLKLR